MATLRRCEVAVLGLGVMGAMALWQASQRSSSVIGFERFGVAHAWGSSHGGSRIFRRVVGEGAAYVPLVRRADELWNVLEREAAVRLRAVTGGLTIGTAGGDFVGNAERAARDGSVDIEVLDVEALRRRFGQHAFLDDDVATYEPGAGVVFPEIAIRAAIAQAAANGAEVRTGTRIISLDPDGDGVRIVTGTDTVVARRAVLATGAWLQELVPGIDLPVRAQRSVPYSFGPVGLEFGPDAFPVFVRKSHHLQVWGAPDVDGRGVKVGVSGAPKPWLRHPDDNWVSAGEDDLALVRQQCHEAFPGLRSVTPVAHPCMNSRTPDRGFLIGAPELAPNLVVVGGFSGHGFKYATAVGEIAADLGLGHTPDIAIDSFALDRFGDRPWPGLAGPIFEPRGEPLPGAEQARSSVTG